MGLWVTWLVGFICFLSHWNRSELWPASTGRQSRGPEQAKLHMLRICCGNKYSVCYLSSLIKGLIALSVLKSFIPRLHISCSTLLLSSSCFLFASFFLLPFIFFVSSCFPFSCISRLSPSPCAHSQRFSIICVIPFMHFSDITAWQHAGNFVL